MQVCITFQTRHCIWKKIQKTIRTFKGTVTPLCKQHSIVRLFLHSIIPKLIIKGNYQPLLLSQKWDTCNRRLQYAVLGYTHTHISSMTTLMYRKILCCRCHKISLTTSLWSSVDGYFSKQSVFLWVLICSIPRKLVCVLVYCGFCTKSH